MWLSKQSARHSRSGWLAIGAVGTAFMLAGVVQAAASTPVDFAHDVVPILKKHCVACHGGREAKGGFSLNTRELLLDAEAAVPRDAAASRMLELIVSDSTDEQMPPADKPRVSPDEVAVLKSWIDQGLVWEPGWSFGGNTYEPPLLPRRPELPPAVDGREHPVDRIIDAYLAEHGVERPVGIEEAAFVRRASLDLTGLLPEPERLEQYLADASPDRRAAFIRELLDDDIAYTEHWLSFWNDLLRNDYGGTGFITGGRSQISKWLYESLATNKPYDQFVRELITPTEESAGFIRGIRWRGNVSASQRQEIQFAQNVSQAFLGINLKCASCHDSFIDRWTLEETYGLAAIYSTESLTLHRCDKPIDKQAVAQWLFPELGQVTAEAPQPERLKQLANLLTHPQNGRFTRTIVNRLWQRLMGRGIVHPVDAMHTQPWSEDLLDFLATDLADHQYNLKHTIELICTSQAWQAATVIQDAEPTATGYVFRGPLPRRMTAEQFIDCVWQVTGSAPVKFDAPVLRVAPQATRPGDVDAAEAALPTALAARWVWSYADAASGRPQAGETITVRRQFELKGVPARAVAAVTCDNEYTLFVNGRSMQSDPDWETVELLPIQSQLRAGKNEILIVAKNGGTGPNPAGLICEVRIQMPVLDRGSTNSNEESSPAPQTALLVLGTDEQWDCTSARPDARGRFRNATPEWQPAVLISNPGVWSARVEPQMLDLLNHADGSPLRMVRASLLKADELMRALGRPNRDQIVTMRPGELTTLEAIDLANGQSLADSIAAGAARLVPAATEPVDDAAADELARRLFALTLSRQPTSQEATVVKDMLAEGLTAQSVEDLLWSLFMLPEFQFVR